MDFNAVGGLRVEGGDQLLHLRRPAAEVATKIRPQGAAILGQPRRERNIKEKVKPSIGDRHQRHPFPLANEGGPLVARRNRLINFHQTVPVNVACVAALRGIAEHVRAQRRMATVGGDQKIAFSHRPVGKPDANPVGIFFAAGDAFTKLHGVAPPEVEHLALQLGAGNRTGTAAGARHQRREAELRQSLPAQIILVSQKIHGAAVTLDNIPHA